MSENPENVYNSNYDRCGEGLFIIIGVKCLLGQGIFFIRCSEKDPIRRTRLDGTPPPLRVLDSPRGLPYSPLAGE